jgi:hypothetical protein
MILFDICRGQCSKLIVVEYISYGGHKIDIWYLDDE